MVTEPESGDVEAILEFLETAPAAIKPWAQARAAEIRGSQVLASESSIIAEPLLKTSEVDELTKEEQAELALAELGEADDDNGLVLSTPQDRPGPAHPNAGRSIPRSTILTLATLLVAALVFGVYWMGRPATQPMPGNMPPAAQERDAEARIKELEKLLEANPKNVEYHLELGVLLINRDDMAGAEEHWLAATKLDEKSIQAWYNLGFLYLSNKPPEMDKARAAWQKVIDIDPKSPLAETVKAHLGRLMGGPTPTPTGR